MTTLKQKRREFVLQYVKNHPNKPIKQIIFELSERLFVGETTIARIISGKDLEYSINQKNKYNDRK